MLGPITSQIAVGLEPLIFDLARCASAASSRILHTSSLAYKSQPVEEAADQFAKNYAAVTLKINGKDTTVPEGTTILQAARDLGIFVPTLCTHPRLPTSPGTCRLCLVEENGRLMPACATPATQGMNIQTDTPTVNASVKGMLALLRANHPNDCMTCDVNGRCEFQDLLSHYNVHEQLPKLRSYSHEWDDMRQHDFEDYHDSSSASIHIDLDKCLKCGRCVTACGMVQGMNVLGFVNRGRDRHPAVLTDALTDSKCIECGQCSSVCPVGAITERSEWRQVLDMLDNKRKTMVVMTAPAVRVAIGEEVGMAPGSITVGQMVTAQRMLGFDHVLDVDFSADLTIMEEGTELLHRLKYALGLETPEPGHAAPGPLPMFTSCCPAWITLVEKSYPHLIPNLSTCKSPQQMLGAVVKKYYANKLGKKPEDICLVSIMPCTAKKHEAEREELKRPGDDYQDVDYVITTREFGHILRNRHIPLGGLAESQFDDPLGESSGAAVLFGATGGVMEAALRTAYEVLTGQPLPRLELQEVRGLQGIKEAVITLPANLDAPLGGAEIRIAVASGVGNARHLIQKIEAGQAPPYHFIEVMACPGGCINGGGNPKTSDPKAVLKRMGAIYTLDQRATIRRSHENKSVQDLYKKFFLEEEPNGHLAHELLHTHYTDRSEMVHNAEKKVDEQGAAGKVKNNAIHHSSM